MHREAYYVVKEMEFWKAFVRGISAPKVPILPYVPERRALPARMVSVPSAWKGIESVLEDVIQRFNISTQRCLEFGVEYGYSTAALSSFFDTVTGVDLFVGDKHTVDRTDIYSDTLKRLSPFHNIQLVRSDYRDWIAKDNSFYGLIHVDIVHTYLDTFHCGRWSAQHAHCVLFHDTLSFPTVKQAVIDVARQTGKRFYHFRESHGLGILV